MEPERQQRLAETLLPAGGSLPPTPPPEALAELALPLDLGAWVAEEVLSYGGMGVVFLGCAKSDGSRVVIKMPLGANREILERFRNEIQILSALEHPRIVRQLGFGELRRRQNGGEEVVPWLVMEYAGGPTLRQKLRQQGRLSWTEVRVLLENMLEALAYLHGKHICHRDVKPDNIIYAPDSRTWKLADFGIAKPEAGRQGLELTLTKAAPGAIDYMSPEQLAGQPADIRSDLYALGKTAWEALIGEVPRVGTPYPSELLGEKEVPVDVDAFLRKMVARAPAERYCDPSEALAALREGAAAMELKGQQKRRRQRLIRAGWALVIVTVVSGTVLMAGNKIATEQARKIFESYKSSPSVAREQLQKFIAGRWFWGRGYARQKLAELEPLARAEKAAMQRQSREIMEELDAARGDAAYRLQRCRGFLGQYHDAFQHAPEYAAMAKRAGELEVTVRMEEILQKLRWDDTDSLLQAQAEMLQLSRTHGESAELKKLLERIDDSLWALAEKEATAFSGGGRIAEARKAVERYLEKAHFKRHEAAAQALRRQLGLQEEARDWDVVSQSARANLQQNAFPLAVRDLTNYLARWPDGSHAADARRLLSEVAKAHLEMLRSLKDLAELQPEFKLFVELHASERALVKQARNVLAQAYHRRIRELVQSYSSGRATAETITRELDAMDLRQFETEDRILLEGLVSAFKHQVVRPRDRQIQLELEYYLQRPPSHEPGVKELPAVWKVFLERVTFELSEATFNRLKGRNEANPYITVTLLTLLPNGKKEGTTLVEGKGEPQKKRFSFPIKREMFFDTRTQFVRVTVADDDYPLVKPEILEWVFSGGVFLKSGPAVETLFDGSLVQIDYSAR